MSTLDLFAQHKDEYTMPKEPALVTVRPGRYLTVSGVGAPGSAAFQAKLGALYSHAYTIKFARRKAGADDFKVGVLEGLWWVPGGTTWLSAPKRSWRWKLLLRVPEFVQPDEVRAARATLLAKGRPATGVKLETIAEGPSVQMLHVGSYGNERRTLAQMDAYARDRHLRFRGRHHEIYLSDPRRVPAARLRTILRHPVARRASTSVSA